MKHGPHSFTLLEVMIVVTLLGLLAGYAFRGALRSTDSPRQILRQLASIDAEARLLARRHGSGVLTLDAGGSLSATSVQLVVGDIKRNYELAAACEVSFGGKGTAEIYIDRHGQSADYTAHIQDASSRLQIAGLTGWSWIEDE